MSDLVAFLNARLDEDEAAAKSAGGLIDSGGPAEFVADAQHYTWRGAPLAKPALEHVARFAPARVLREVEAKRKIVAAYEAALHSAAAYKADGEPEPEWHIMRRTAFEFSCSVLARAYPDYDPAWA